MGPAAVLLAVSLATTTGFGPQPKLPSILTKWQPPSSAPLPAPLLAGNRTAVFVHAPSVERTQPFSHWFTDDVAATFFGGLEHSSALTDVFLSGGHSLVKASAPIVPTGADADLMTLCTRRLHTMQVRVLPVVSATKDVVVDWISQSDENKVELSKALFADQTKHGYDGYVLDWDLSALDGAGDDDANLASFLVLLAESLAANHGGLILTIPAARSTDNLAKGIANTPTVGVAVTEATAVRDFERFKVAQAAAAAQFGQTSMRNLWTGFTLSTKIWDPRPTIVDTRTRMDALASGNVENVVIDLDFATNELAFIDLFGYLLGAYLGGAGLPWETLSPPQDGSDATYGTWSSAVAEWRTERRQDMGFPSDAANALANPANPAASAATAYDDPDLAWVRSNFVSPQVMLHDRYLFDRNTGNWTVDKWMQDVTLRYGGVDSVLLWHSYPNIGVDDRSQFAMLASLPGGLKGVATLVAEFHRHGVQVLLPYNPWDTGTAPAANGASMQEQLIGAIHAVDADGFNGDTMYGINRTWYESSKTDGGRSIATQPECGVDERHETNANGTSVGERTSVDLRWNTLSWNYWPYLPPGNYSCSGCAGGSIDASPMASKIAGVGPPLLSRARILDSRHMAQICERWAQKRTDGLQHAFINGGGYAPWESIWGVWNPLSEGDGQALDRTMHVLKYFNAQVIGGAFSPTISAASEPGVFVSQFSPNTAAKNTDFGASSSTLWTIINRRGADGVPDAAKATTRLPNDVATVVLPAATGPFNFFDVWHGLQLNATSRSAITSPIANATAGALVSFSVPISPRSFGAVAMVSNAEASSDGFRQFMAKRREYARTPLASLNYDTFPLQQTMTGTGPAAAANDAGTAANMSAVPSGDFDFVVHGVQVEGFGGLLGAAPMQQPDVQFPWEARPQRQHRHLVHTGGFAIDKYPVTNARFKSFLDATGWKPRFSQNFLRHWQGAASSPVTGTEEQPVRWVSLGDARAFCAAEGKRLPHSWEWSVAAEGFGEKKPAYPWGDTWDSAYVPSHTTGREMGEPAIVGTHPAGSSSSFGVEDLVGTIWQWSDEFCDEHTCRAIVRGGSWYSPQGSCWYFPAGWRLDEQNTILLLSDSMDRSAGIGFRCVMDN